MSGSIHGFPLTLPSLGPVVVLRQVPRVERPRIVEITFPLPWRGDHCPGDGAFVLPEAVGLRGGMLFLDQLAVPPDVCRHVPAAPPASNAPAARFWIFCRSHRLPLVPIGTSVSSCGVCTRN